MEKRTTIATDTDISNDDGQVAELEYSDEEPNLVPVFMEHEEGKAFLKELSNEILSDRDEAWSSCDEMREKRKTQWDLFTGKIPKRKKEYEDMARVGLTVLLESVSRLQSRACAELFGDWSSVFAAVPLGPDDVEKAELISLHQNWQIVYKIQDFPRQMQRGLLHFYLFGDVMADSYWDPKRRSNRHEILTMDDFIIPFAAVSTMPDLSDCPYRIKLIRMYVHSLEAMRGIWYGIDDVIDRKSPSWIGEPELEMARENAKNIGIAIDEITKAPHTILQYEGWKKLPKQNRQRFIQAFVDNSTGTIMQLSIFEEVPWDEVIRYDMQNDELANYRQAKREYNLSMDMLLQQKQDIQRNPESSVLDIMDATSPNTLPPVAPAWMKNPDDDEETPVPKKTEPVHMFSHQVCIESLSGVYGIGYGSIVAPYNIAANQLLTQYIDSASLGNCNPLLTTDEVSFKNGYKIGPMVINQVSGLSGQPISEHIMRMNPGQANPQLRELIDMLLAKGEASIQSPDVLSGEPGKSGETWRGQNTRLEQATKLLSVSTRQFAWFVEQLGRNNARLNSYFMDDEEIFMVNNHMAGQTQYTIDKKLYQRDYSVRISSDMKYTSTAQKIMDAEKILQMALQVPQLQANPSFIYKAIKEYLVAMGKNDLVAFLGPEPPPPTSPAIQPPVPPPPTGPVASPGM